MARSFVACATLTAGLLAVGQDSSPPAKPWKIMSNQTGAAFWDGFTAADPTHGYVDFVNASEAKALGLAGVNAQGQVFMKVDTSAVDTGPRKSTRLASKAAVDVNDYAQPDVQIVLIDASHVPTGCGVWPAFWMVGADWPHQGEIDIIEGANGQVYDQTTLHTGPNCTNSAPQSFYSGQSMPNLVGGPSLNCDVKAKNQGNNAGCGIRSVNGSLGTALNAAGGGVWAMLWEKQTATRDGSLRSWFWPRASIPADVEAQQFSAPNAQNQPSTWGKPYVGKHE